MQYALVQLLRLTTPASLPRKWLSYEKAKHMNKRIVLTLALLLSLSVLSACNTIAGVGRDIERAGEVMQDAAKKK